MRKPLNDMLADWHVWFKNAYGGWDLVAHPGSGIVHYIDPENIFNCGIYELVNGRRRQYGDD
jgi:hypothetical protein